MQQSHTHLSRYPPPLTIIVAVISRKSAGKKLSSNSNFRSRNTFRVVTAQARDSRNVLGFFNEKSCRCQIFLAKKNVVLRQRLLVWEVLQKTTILVLWRKSNDKVIIMYTSKKYSVDLSWQYVSFASDPVLLLIN